MEQRASMASECSLDQLVVSALQHLKDRGYSRRSLKRQRIIWTDFVKFATRHHPSSNTFSRDLANRYLEHRGIPDDTVRLTPHKQHIRRAMHILTEYAENGSLGPRSKWTPSKPPLPAAFGEMLTEYERICSEHHGYRPNTITLRRRHLVAFLSWLASRGVDSSAGISPTLISTYISSLGHLKATTVGQCLISIRSFLRHLAMRGLVSQDLCESLPTVRCRRDANIPSVWLQKDAEALLAGVDRNTPGGKRDLAILLLACRLGMRAGDIRSLRLEHLRWGESRIERAQSKTGEALCLPLSNEVGEAIIDYLRNGRQPSQSREVFLQVTAPYQPLSENDHLWHIIEKHRRNADIPPPPAGQRGLHSLRHTLATRLLEKETPIETIASVLGHRSIESTRIYTKVDLSALRSAALDPEELLNA